MSTRYEVLLLKKTYSISEQFWLNFVIQIVKSDSEVFSVQIYIFRWWRHLVAHAQSILMCAFSAAGNDMFVINIKTTGISVFGWSYHILIDRNIWKSSLPIFFSLRIFRDSNTFKQKKNRWNCLCYTLGFTVIE